MSTRFADYEQRAALLRALAEPHRLQIMELLHGGPQLLTDIVIWLEEVSPRPLAYATVSHHMQALRRAGMVVGEKEVRSVRYALVPDRVLAVVDDALPWKERS